MEKQRRIRKEECEEDRSSSCKVMPQADERGIFLLVRIT